MKKKYEPEAETAVQVEDKVFLLDENCNSYELEVQDDASDN